MSASRITAVPLLDLTRTDDLWDELREAFDSVMRSGRYINGPEVTGLEAECAEYTGAAHGVGVSSGTDALIVALMALEVGRGDEVICPSFTFFATAGSIWRVGAKPVFVDSNPWSFNIDPGQFEATITSRTKAVIPVHLFGQCADMTAINTIACQRELWVIEDAAQAIGARHDGQGAGSMGAFGCFSFFPTKNLGALGDGGLVTANDENLANRVRMLRDHGMRPKYFHEHVGGNFRLDALQAAFLRIKLRRLDAAADRRRENAQLYRKLFAEAGVVADPDGPRDAHGPLIEPGYVDLPRELSDQHIYNQFVIRVPAGRRDALRASLSDDGVGTEVYYPVPLHLQACFASLGGEEGQFPVAERASREVLALPIFPELRPEEIEYVVARIVNWCGRER